MPIRVLWAGRHLFVLRSRRGWRASCLRPIPVLTSPCIESDLLVPQPRPGIGRLLPAPGARTDAWAVNFKTRRPTQPIKSGDQYVRAVRGGSPSGAFLDVTSGRARLTATSL